MQQQLGDEGVKAAQQLANVAAPPPAARGPGMDLDSMRWEDNWFTNGVTWVHRVLPRSGELYQLLDERLQQDLAFGTYHPPPKEDRPPPPLLGFLQLPSVRPTPPPLAEVLGVSCAFIAVMLGLACWRFSVRDY
jgi:hypothetical protein